MRVLERTYEQTGSIVFRPCQQINLLIEVLMWWGNELAQRLHKNMEGKILERRRDENIETEHTKMQNLQLG